MEHRLHKRYPIKLMVRLVVIGQAVVVARADDICTEGMSIKNPGIAINAGQKIVVDFFKPGHPRPVSYCASAQVIHSSRQAIGLKFDSDLPTRAILDEQQHASADLLMQKVS